MATVLSTLYPPLIDTFMPAFPKTESAVINFSISPYNSRTSITKLHVSIVDQRTNLSVLKPSGYLTDLVNGESIDNNNSYFVNGIWIIDAKAINLNNLQINTNNTCQLTIPPEALKDGSFITSNYYKVQLRFSNDTENIGINLDNNYLTKNRPYFSEWSSICLIKAIPNISLQIAGYDPSNKIKELEQTSRQYPESFPAGIIPIAGNVQFEYGESIDTEDSTGLTSNLNYYQISTKDQETLRSYQVTVENEADETDTLESEIIYTYGNEDPNRIYWLADLTNAEAGDLYSITVNCTTKNQYTFSFTYYIRISNYSTIRFEPEWSFGNKIYDDDSNEVCVFPDLQEDGQLKVTINFPYTTGDGGEPLGAGYLYIKRATSLDNFKHWELLKCTSFVGSQGVNVQDTFIDTTLGSLVRYKYSCQYKTQKGPWTPTDISPEIIYPDFYDILLSRGDKQLAIRYNGQISNMTPVVNRVKIDTLGGKYPKFAENAKMNYKQFQLSGMIIAESDYNRKFLSDLDYREDMAFYDEQENGKYILRNDTLPDAWDRNVYGTYNSDISKALDPTVASTKTQKHKRDTSDFKNIDGTETVNISHDLYPLDNWWWERTFREEAIKWLNDGEPKLFRSMTEGNLVVMLTDISLTPNPQVNRRTYNFSATVYEIADGYSLDTLSDLGIWNLQNDYENLTEEETSEELIRNIVSQSFSITNNDSKAIGIKSSIQDYYNLLYNGVLSEYIVTDTSYMFKNLKIQFESKPQWYNIYNGEITRLDEVTDNNKGQHALGYVIQLEVYKVGKIDVFVNEKGYYQAPSNVEILDVYLQPGDTATIDYILHYSLEFNDTAIANSIEVVESVVGQLSGLWYPNLTLRQAITSKYAYVERASQYDSNQGNNGVVTSQTFESWQGVSFDISPYTTVAIKFTDSDSYSDYLIGRTGVYNLMRDDILIDDIYIKGRRMFKVYDTGSTINTSKKYNLDEWEFIKENIIYSSIEQIVKPKYNHIYKVNNSWKIYYIDDQWYDFEFILNDEIGLAKVPVNGMINYKGDIVKKTYT